MRGAVKRIPPTLRSFAQRLRGGQTDAEQKLWMHLRNGLLKGWKFRRQHPIGNYIVDFCCLEGMLIIELDGGQHLEQKATDEERTKYLNSVGFRVLRFWNDDVLTKVDDVLEEVLRALEGLDASDPHPSLVLSPRPSPGREREQENSPHSALSFQEKNALKEGDLKRDCGCRRSGKCMRPRGWGGRTIRQIGRGKWA